jgi:hypothetical protein
VAAATARLDGLSIADKNELLFQHGLTITIAQQRALGSWESYERPATNPKWPTDDGREAASARC